jgi:hypothetical protein
MTAASVTASRGGIVRPPGDRVVPRRVLGGACAEIAWRLNAPVGFLRGIVLVACGLSSRLVFVYVATGLLIPHAERRRPGWENVVGALRVGLLFGVLYAVSSGGILGSPLVDQSPAVWITQGGLLLATIVALLAAPPIVGPDLGDRELALASLALIALAGVIVVGMVLAPQVRWEEVAASVVVFIGVVLVVGGRRARALLLPALVAACGVVLLAASGARLQGGIGRADARPVRLGTPSHSYRLAIGSLHVDLSALRAGHRPRTLTVSVGIGHLDLTVPATAAVEIDAHVGRGTLFAELASGPPVTGFAIHRMIHSAALSGGNGGAISPAAAARLRSHPAMRLRINAEVGIGTLQIDRGAVASAGSRSS